MLDFEDRVMPVSALPDLCQDAQVAHVDMWPRCLELSSGPREP